MLIFHSYCINTARKGQVHSHLICFVYNVLFIDNALSILNFRQMIVYCKVLIIRKQKYFNFYKIICHSYTYAHSKYNKVTDITK